MEKIKNRFTGEIMCRGLSLKIVLEKHKKWCMEEKDGKRADLSGAYLRDANLRDANLRGAYLRDADLRDADLRGADLRDAYLRGAYLRDAKLRGADLRDAYLSGADLRQFKHDVWGVLAYAKSEVPNLIKAIKEGRIDGSQYEGECCCLCGTLEKGLPAQIDIRAANSPAEQWFSMIKKGDTPENNFASEKALEWVQEWADLMLLEREL